MKFRTELKPSPSNLQIDYENGIVLMGSCFSDNIGQKLIQNKFDVLLNPFGTVYNPITLVQQIESSLNDTALRPEDLKLQQDLYFSLNVHHSFAALNATDFIDQYQKAKRNLFEALESSKVLILSLGSSIAYKYLDTGQIIGNCHKMPAHHFEKINLTIPQIKAALKTGTDRLKSINPQLEMIFTISPVRHIRNGIVENNRSKARLITAIDELISENPSINYFPAYELLLDDLRDYRFYTSDLVHPNQMAVDYIWEQFKLTYLSAKCQKQIQEVDKIISAVNHKAFNPESTAHQNFINETLKKIEQVEAETNRSFEHEKETLRKQLI